MRKRLLLLSLAVVALCVGVWFVQAAPAWAAGVNAGLTPEVETSLGLGTTDIRVSVARMIRIFMGLLGIIAVALIIYGGVLWMTSAGNEEQIDKARKTIIGAVIGLAIILSAFSIASFVINALTKATGASPGVDSGGAGATLSCVPRPPDGCPAGSFADPEHPNELCCTQNTLLGGTSIDGLPSLVVLGFSPMGAVPLRNVTVRALLSADVDPATVTDALRVETISGDVVAGSVTASGALIEFTPEATCPEPNQDRRCLAGDTDFRVTLQNTVATPDGLRVACAPQDPRCTSTFRTGNEVDTAAPSVVEILSPDDGQSIIQGDQMPIQVRAADDAGIGAVEMLVDGNVVGRTVSNGPTADFTSVVLWDSTEAAVGEHSVGATAADWDSNQTSVAPIAIQVRPAACGNGLQDADETGLDCGGSCGACGGGACQRAGDCAGGMCRAGVCSDVPRIDRMTPADGALGSLVTLIGVGFGDTAGTVTFLGSDAEGDEQIAGICAPSAWSDREITVIVPSGAQSGAVRITTASGEQDDTIDARGPMIGPFTVNNRVRPGVCVINPDSGKAGDPLQVSGTGFGAGSAMGDRVVFRIDGRDISIPATSGTWSPERIQSVVPSVTTAAATRGSVRVRAGGVDSNEKAFTLLPAEAGTRPEITNIQPSSGPIDAYLTIRGRNFGSRLGVVRFSFPDGTVADASVDFPALCTNRTWSETQVMVKVPAFYRGGSRGRSPLSLGAHDVTLTRTDGASSNAVSFRVSDEPLAPGICAIDPDNGPPETAVRIAGEHFGDTPGVVLFTPNSPATVDGRWTDRDISRIGVPANAETGAVTVTATDRISNGVAFTVARCTDAASCGAGRACCADGVCRDSCGTAGPGGSTPTPRAGAFVWRFSTGQLSHLPQVVEQSSCTADTQSPSPFRDTRDACVNALVALRFTEDMEPASVISAFRMHACNAGEGFDPTACGDTAVAGRVDVTRADGSSGVTPRYESRLTFSPQETLAPNTWYEATVAGSARSADGVLLDGDSDGSEGGDYVFRFRTRSANDPCGVGTVAMSPARFVATSEREQVAYRADATAANCNVLQCAAFDWEWRAELAGGGDASGLVSLDDAAGGDAPPHSCAYIATALGETDPDHPVEVTAAILSAGQSGTGSLTIHYLEPRVLRTAPTCAAACVNTAIRADFNIPLDPATLTPDTVRIFTCRNESCRDFLEPSGISGFAIVGVPDAAGRMTSVSLVPQASGLLRRSSYYRVVISGGAAGVRSLSGAPLAGANAGNDYIWTFRTRDDDSACGVDRVVVTPSAGSVSLLGDVAHYTVTAYGTADDCSADGQPLAATDYRWTWETANTDPSVTAEIASIDFGDTGGKDVLPLAEGQFCSNACLLTGSSGRVSVCGNNTLERGEDCDDGNTADADGCSARCLNEGSTGRALCGNGAREASEDCDDGNTMAGDGCSNRCLNEGAVAGGSICGSGDLGDGEDCDDGNASSGDGCSAQCLHEGSRPGPLSVCGNGSRESGEACDDGNATDGDGCSASCLLEGNELLCDATTADGCCGNSVTDRSAGESCDDGNATSGDGCSSVCTFEGSSARYGLSRASASYCGDTVVGFGEQCEFSPPAGDGRGDPDAFVRAVLGGEAMVRASVVTASGDTVSGEARFSAACSCQADSDCAGLAPGGTTAMGCGAGRCCAPRPTVRPEFIPEDGAVGVCRNTALSMVFSMPMDRDSISGETIVLAERSTTACADGRDSGVDGFCVSDAQPVPVAREQRLPSGATVTAVDVRLTDVLEANQEYRVIVRGGGVRSATGVTLAGDVSWSFTTGPNVCALARVTVAPQHHLFSTAENNPADDTPGPRYDSQNDADKIYRAEALSDNDEVIVPTPNYNWTWGWTSSDGTAPGVTPETPPTSIAYPESTSAEAVIRTLPNPENGTATITATATVTADATATACDPAADVAEQERICGRGLRCAPEGTPTAGHCVGTSRRASAQAAVMLCQNPWPSRAADGSWEPFTNDSYTFSMHYCRDRGAPTQNDDLPALPESAVPVQRSAVLGAPILSDLLFPVVCDVGDANCQIGDAIGMRILANPSHVRPSRWYTNQRFTGQPVSTSIDGYDAIEDGRTVYVNAGALSPAGSLYTNMYVLSYTEAATETTQEIVRQLRENMQFNTNLVEQNTRVCSLKTCSRDASRACVNDSDCGGTGTAPEAGVCISRSCTADHECGGGGVCHAPKDKLARDVRRFQDLAEMSLALEGQYALNRTCSASPNEACLDDAYCQSRGLGERCVGTYPALSAGSFIRGMSTSRWPSWQSGLGNAIGSAVPEDPVNVFRSGLNSGSVCAEADGFDNGTCWNEGARVFQCPADSHLYIYRKSGRGYELGTEFEFRFCSNAPTQICSRDAECVGGSCVMTNWSTVLAPVSHGAQGILNSFRFDHICTDAVVSAAAGSCGDGVVGPGEECEVGDTELEACDAGGRPGMRRWTCTDSCTIARPACQSGRCGDGIVQPPESCDDGSQNGSYGRCSITCQQLAGHCGDGDVQSGEVCDFGGRCSTSGAACTNDAACPVGEQCLGSTRYAATSGQSCSADCRRPGPYCGDRVVDTAYGEECETGQVDTLACGVDASGRQMTQTRSCDARCRFTEFGSCTTGSSCGDGIRQDPEVCDDGNRIDTDGCTNACRPNVCGDGRAWRGREECDLGATNVDVSNPSAVERVRSTCAYGRTCSYCTTACRSLTVSGGTCGDGVITRPTELCEAGDLRYVTFADEDDRASSQCAADCRSACPPTTVAAPVRFQPTQPAGRITGGATDEVILRHGPATHDIIIPSCRPGTLTNVTADISLAEATEVDRTAVLFMIDTSGSMNVRSETGRTRMEEVVAGHADDGGAIDQLIAGYDGLEEYLQIGFLTYQGGGASPVNVRTTSDYLSGWGDFVPAGDPAAAVALKEGIRSVEHTASGHTPARSAAEEARRLFAALPGVDRKVLVFLTNASFLSPSFAAAGADDQNPATVLNAMRTTEGVHIYTIAYNDDWAEISLVNSWAGICGPGGTDCVNNENHHFATMGAVDTIYNRIVSQLVRRGFASSHIRIGSGPPQSVTAGASISLREALAGVNCTGAPMNLPISAILVGEGFLRVGNSRASACPLTPGSP